jgi:hypothetical protein
MKLSTKLTVMASLLTTITALAAMPESAHARAPLYLCDPTVAASGVCLENAMVCSDAQQLCEILANVAGCPQVDYTEQSYCTNLTSCGEQQDAVVCFKAVD